MARPATHVRESISTKAIVDLTDVSGCRAGDRVRIVFEGIVTNEHPVVRDGQVELDKLVDVDRIVGVEVVR